MKKPHHSMRAMWARARSALTRMREWKSRFQFSWKKWLLAFLALLGIHQHLSAQQKQDIAFAGFIGAPGTVTAGGAKLMGTATDVTLNNTLMGISIFFFVLQIAYLIWKWKRDYRLDQREQERDQERGRQRCTPEQEDNQ